MLFLTMDFFPNMVSKTLQENNIGTTNINAKNREMDLIRVFFIVAFLSVFDGLKYYK